MTTDTPLPNSSLSTRLKSALILAPAVLLILYFGGGSFAILIAAMAGIAVFEWARMVMSGETAMPRFLPHFSGILAGIGVAAAGLVDNPVSTLWLLLALCFLISSYSLSREGPSVRTLVIGIIYIGFSADVMIWLRNVSDHGLYNMLTLLFIVWASDVSAYFSGKAIGGPKLAPVISPNKTWAGFFGSSVGAGIVAALMALPWVTGPLSVTPIGGMGPVGYFIMGFVLAMFGQLGDLGKSIFKRHHGVKDTGSIIPGHGGVLDRIDALLLVALIFGSMVRVLG